MILMRQRPAATVMRLVNVLSTMDLHNTEPLLRKVRKVRKVVKRAKAKARDLDSLPLASRARAAVVAMAVEAMAEHMAAAALNHVIYAMLVNSNRFTNT